jgi:tRNA A37 threonylcarbamoyladenosine biosynthesis protein TsaE
VIEWAEKAVPILPARTIYVRIEGAGEEPREIEVAGLAADRADALRLGSSSPV